MKKIILIVILIAAGALVFIFFGEKIQQIFSPDLTPSPEAATPAQTPIPTPPPAGGFTPTPTTPPIGGSTPTSTQPPAVAPAPTPILTSTPAPQVHNVEIRNFAFVPAELKIAKGDSVVWKNMDGMSHTVTSDSGSELDSPLLSSGMVYSHTFSAAGIYDYHCVPHPFMKGKIIVE